MLCKKDFIRTINMLENYHLTLNQFSDAYSKLGHKLSIGESNISEEFINTLEESFKDKECQWIRYFIEELKFGKRYFDGSVKVKGKVTPLKTAEDLYELLMVYCEQKKEVDIESNITK